MSAILERFGWSTRDAERRWRACSSRLEDRLADNMITLNFRPLCEPRGFIRILQLILAIVAFSVICDFRGQTTLTVDCTATSTAPQQVGEKKKWTVNISYPFAEKLEHFTEPLCGDATVINSLYVHVIPCGVQGPAEYLVTVGVISMVLCIIALPIYVLKSDAYGNNNVIPLTDFVLTALLTLLWFIAACGWASATVKLKGATGADDLAKFVTACTVKNVICNKDNESPQYSKLDVGVVFAFLNVLVWAGSCWFVYKDTRLHQAPSMTSPASNTGWPPAPAGNTGPVTTTTTIP